MYMSMVKKLMKSEEMRA